MSINHIIHILQILKVKTTVDKRSKTINDSAKALFRSDEDVKESIILTSITAIKNYDSYHPERITCIVLKKQQNDVLTYYVVVNDRDIDIEKALRFWWLNDEVFNADNMSCVVCMRNNRKNIMCCHCRALICLSCHDKLTNNESMQCPICRQWNLYGPDFGTPFLDTIHDNQSNYSIDSLYQLLDKLDGCMRIFIRINNRFYNEGMVMTKLSGTNRYAHDSMRLKDIKKRLNNRRTTKNITIWLFRNTFKILDDKPIQEVSVFGLDSNDQLYQYGKNAWINVFDSDEFTMVKTEYLEPHKFVLPDYVKQVFSEISIINTDIKTISITDEQKNGMNFDMDENGNITTMHDDMLAAFYCKLQNKPLFLICRTNVSHSILAYELNDEKAIRLLPKEVQKLVERNLDDLHSRQSLYALHIEYI